MDGTELRNLWERAFGDTEKYMDYYFSHKACVSERYTDSENGELVSMAFFTPYPVVFRGKACKSFYIVGVATEEKYRHEHRMTRLLERAMETCRKKKIPFVFLCPETPAVYKSLGFVPIYQRETTYIDGNYVREQTDKTVTVWDKLSETEQMAAVSFANEMLEKEAFDLYIERSVTYYNDVASELQALDGELLVVWDACGAVHAVVNLIYEEERYQITEFIADSCQIKKTVDALLQYLQTDKLQIDDSYFLHKFCETGVTKKRQEKPYIMYRMLFGESPVIRCYINDIT